MSDTEAKEDDDKDCESQIMSPLFATDIKHCGNVNAAIDRNKLEKQDSTQSTDSLKRKRRRKKKVSYFYLSYYLSSFSHKSYVNRVIKIYNFRFSAILCIDVWVFFAFMNVNLSIFLLK